MPRATNHAVTRATVLGVLSLILWALIVVVTLKYVLILLRADNNGEGGTLSLTALASRALGRRTAFVFIVGVIGAADVPRRQRDHAGDLGAVGGGRAEARQARLQRLRGAAHGRHPDRAVRRAKPRHRQGGRLVRARSWWSGSSPSRIAGALHIRDDPHVLAAINPLYGIDFLLEHGHIGLVTLGAVFLAVTGGEALYADLGHFGRKPIQTAWLCLVLPALLINYFGQGAKVLADPAGDRKSVLPAGAGDASCCRWSCWRPPRP